MNFTYVKCQDGRYYRDPMWERRDWYITIDGSETEIIIVRKPDTGNPDDARKSVINILNAIGIKANIIMNSYRGNERRVFPSGVKPASRFLLEILSTPPVPPKFSGVKDSRDEIRGGIIHEFDSIKGEV